MKEIAILKHTNDYKTTNWSGGTTTELYIYPETSNYQKRDFLWRLSSATIDIEKSIFTPLPDIKRVLMILDGKIKIEHENMATKILNPFDKDIFDGSIKTVSFGKATDFNLMLKVGFDGDINHFTIKENEKKVFSLSKKNNFYGFYCYKGEINIKTKDNRYELKEKSFLLLKNFNSEIIINGKTDSIFLYVNIKELV